MDVKHISELNNVSIITEEMLYLVNELRDNFVRGYYKLKNDAYVFSIKTFTVGEQDVDFVNHQKHFLVYIVLEGQERIQVRSVSDKCFMAVSSKENDDISVQREAEREEDVVLGAEEFCVIYPVQAYKPSTSDPSTSGSEVKKVVIYVPYEE